MHLNIITLFVKLTSAPLIINIPTMGKWAFLTAKDKADYPDLF